jgi:pseudouridine synthase
MRINQYIASAGITSRRKADEMIEAGRVRINGAVLLNPGYHVQEGDIVEVDGTRIEPEQKKVYYLLNKPAGYVTSTSDKEGRPVVTELVPDGIRVFPVGRLDYNTTGLLILTNDGTLAHSLLDPKRHVWKRYIATVEGRLDESDVQAFAEGIPLKDFTAKPAQLRILEAGNEQSRAEVEVREGKFHQVKRMCAKVGKNVVYLKRCAIGGVLLDEALEIGSVRELTLEELELLAAGVLPPLV